MTSIGQTHTAWIPFDERGPSCLASGTRLLTPEGWRSIDDLRRGDVLCVFVPGEGEPTTAILERLDSVERECVFITVGDASLILTSDHPVYCPDTQDCHPAGDWVLGERRRVLRLTNEEDSMLQVDEVIAKQTFAGIKTVFELHLEQGHHHVIANGILVRDNELED